MATGEELPTLLRIEMRECPRRTGPLMWTSPTAEPTPVGALNDASPAEQGTVGGDLQQAPLSVSASQAVRRVSTGSTEHTGRRMCLTERQKWWIELFLVAVIIVNMICIGLEFELDGLHQGQEQFGKGGYISGSLEECEKRLRWLQWSDHVLGVITWFEVVFRTWQVCSQLWHTYTLPHRKDMCLLFFDVVIVAAWIFDMLRAGDDHSFWLVLRFLRLVRVFGLVRTMRHSSHTDSLLIIATSLKGSCVTCLFAIFVLFIVEWTFAILMNRLLSGRIDDISLDPEIREQLWDRFGTTFRSMLTMFSMLFGEWYETCLLLYNHVNDWIWMPLLLHQFVVSFGVLAIVQGVFINQTFHTLERDDEVMIRRKMRGLVSHSDRMKTLFFSADVNGDGRLTFSEFVDKIKDEAVCEWLSAYDIDIDMQDAYRMANMIFDSDEHRRTGMTPQQLADRMQIIQGSARRSDVSRIETELRDVRRATEELTTALLNINDRHVLV